MVWFCDKQPPRGYVAVGCVVEKGDQKPDRDSVFCAKESVVERRALSRIGEVKEGASVLSLGGVPLRGSGPSGLQMLNVNASKEVKVGYGIRETSVVSSPAAEGASAVTLSRAKSAAEVELTEKNCAQCVVPVSTYTLVWSNKGSDEAPVSFWRPQAVSNDRSLVLLGDCLGNEYSPPGGICFLADMAHYQARQVFAPPESYVEIGTIENQSNRQVCTIWSPMVSLVFFLVF